MAVKEELSPRNCGKKLFKFSFEFAKTRIAFVDVYNSFS